MPPLEVNSSVLTTVLARRSSEYIRRNAFLNLPDDCCPNFLTSIQARSWPAAAVRHP